MSFLTGTQRELLYSLNAPLTKNAYTTEAAFSGVLGTNQLCKVPGGFFGLDNPYPVGRCLYLVAMGTIANTAAATFAVALGFDPTAGTKSQGIAVAGALAPTASTVCPWRLEAWYTCTAWTDSAMTLQVNGSWRVESVASGGVPTTAAQSSQFSGTHSGATVDPRVTNYIELFGTWSANSASNTTTLQQMILEGLN